MIIYVTLNDEKRVISANYDRYGKEEIAVELPQEINDLSEIHQYVYDEEKEQLVYLKDNTSYVIESINDYDKLEAQILYTAMMTDTLMEG